MRIVSLLPSATEALFALGLGDQVVAVTHECDYPPEAAALPIVTRSTLQLADKQSGAIDAAVSLAALEGRSLYSVDTGAILALQPDLVVAQDICDVCQGRLVARTDDNPEALAVRLAEYHEQTRPLIEIFQRKEYVATVDATRPVDYVQATIRESFAVPAPAS